MTTTEAIELLGILETNIRGLVRAFETDTGLVVSAVSLKRLCFATDNLERKQSLCAKVTCDVRLSP